MQLQTLHFQTFTFLSLRLHKTTITTANPKAPHTHYKSNAIPHRIKLQKPPSNTDNLIAIDSIQWIQSHSTGNQDQTQLYIPHTHTHSHMQQSSHINFSANTITRANRSPNKTIFPRTDASGRARNFAEMPEPNFTVERNRITRGERSWH